MNPNPRTATFLFTDLENSTPLWENHPALMQELAAQHDTLMREAIEAHRGRVVKTTGDGFHAIFETAADGVAAAVAGQQAMIGELWPAETGPLRVRMGLHTGESREREGDYYGPEVNRAARVMGLANGGQVLISEATAALIRTALPPDVSLTDLGEHRLRGLVVPEQIFQICHPALQLEFPPLKSLSAYRHNLRVQRSTFIGREKELVNVKHLLKETHVLTLLGPGGTGKTRLMLEAAEEVIGDFADGVWLVELAPLTDASLIAERVAAALNVQEQPGRTMLDTLDDYLRRKELLLLLDNVEHMVRESAEFAEYLLERCPTLKILVTGREALFIEGETTLQIPSLSLPTSDEHSNLEAISVSEGVQLFLDRARNVHPDFELTEANATPIAEIVRRLDGIPLALELAAARLRMLKAEQIAERLNDRFRLLTGGRRTALARQQTLQALIDWSWNLLDEKERLLLQRLSVFSGGWTLEAALAVAGDEHLGEFAIFDLLEQLVNKSLVTVNYPTIGEARYGMLESIRQYGRDRLFEAGEGAGLSDRHADYYVTFAEEAGRHLSQSKMLPWVERIRLELDNLRVVLAWTLEDRPELALRIGGNLLSFEVHWLTPREARTWLEPAVEKTRSLKDKDVSKVQNADFIKALISLGITHEIQGRFASALPFLEESAQLAREIDESRLWVISIARKAVGGWFNLPLEGMLELEEAIAISRENGFEDELVWSTGIYALALSAQGRTELAMSHLEEVSEITQRIDNPLSNASLYRTRGLLTKIQGDLDEAKRLILLSIENYEVLKDRRNIIRGQSEVAHILRQEGNIEEAEAYYRNTIIGWQEQGHLPAVAHQLECFAYIAITREKYEHSATLLGSAMETRERMNALSRDPIEIQELATAMDRLGEAMDVEERDRFIAEGRLIALDEAVQMALNEISLN
jgi:predicted ATPase/class 3 adenylate cyclase